MSAGKSTMRWAWNERAREESLAKAPEFLCMENLRQARRFHRSLPGYSPTPLVALPGLARELGLGSILVKDESCRFGLQAFKVLGASYAVSRALSERCGHPGESLPLSILRELLAKDGIGLHVATATDGNHGRAIAWTARQLGLPSVVYLPAASTAARIERIRAEGADTLVVDGNYDEAVRRARDDAEKQDWLLVQDTSWPGYEEVPRWIMQGYGTLMDEASEQLRGCSKRITHAVLQGGVGSFAGATLGYLVGHAGQARPTSVVLEPLAADCLLQSMRARDGRPHEVAGELDTIMAGLACGRPNPIAWQVLCEWTDCFAACGDNLAALGMRVLGNPVCGDPKVVSGESGAIGLGFLCAVMTRSSLRPLRQKLALGPDSCVLAVSTEGNTDPRVYRSVVWNGAWPCRLDGEAVSPDYAQSSSSSSRV